jgi:CPA1 family monovalent cation:H+ antiporter
MEIAVSFLTPFAAYLVPQNLGGSGILATVATGMYIGERSSTLVPAGTRLHATSAWDMVEFLLNGLMFLMAGLELHRVIGMDYRLTHLVLWSVAIAAGVTIVRAVWCLVTWYLLEALRRKRGEREGSMPARQLGVIAWCGMRGPVSLAAALSIPAAAHGATLPQFDTVVFITAAVIVVTLLIFGGALPLLVRVLGVARDAAEERRAFQEQERVGRRESARAALARLSEIMPQPEEHKYLEGLRNYYETRLDGSDSEAPDPGDRAATEISSKLIAAERDRILQLRAEGRISDHALQRLERSLDLRQSLADSEAQV